MLRIRKKMSVATIRMSRMSAQPKLRKPNMVTAHVIAYKDSDFSGYTHLLGSVSQVRE